MEAARGWSLVGGPLREVVKGWETHSKVCYRRVRPLWQGKGGWVQKEAGKRRFGPPWEAG